MYEELIVKLRQCGGGTEGIKIASAAADALENMNRRLDAAMADIVPSCDICTEYKTCFEEPKVASNYQHYKYCHDNGHSNFKWNGYVTGMKVE